jgi:protocatechuate 3,4-dioxygenase beta subunit
MRAIRAWRYNLILLMVLTAVNPCLLQAQSGTSSALSGDVTDASGAAVSNATVTATDVNTKATRSGATDAAGHFLFSQVNPGTYQVTVEANGFAISKSEPTPVGVGRTAALNFSLRVQSSNQSIEVTAQQGLLSLDNPNTTTTIDAKVIKNMPNPART